MADRKISATAALTGANVDKAVDYIPIIDAGEADADKNKRILINELRRGMFCGACAKKTVDETTANYSAGVGVPWPGTDVFDTDAWHDPTTNNSRMTVPAGLGISKVLITGSVGISLFQTGSQIRLEIMKNGSVSFDGAMGVNPYSIMTTPDLSVVGIVDCTAGDYFELKLTISDTSITVEAATSHFTIMAVG